MKRQKLLVWAGAILLAFIIGVLYTYWHYLGHLKISREDPGPWGQLGDYIGGLLNPAIALVNTIAVVYVGFTLSRIESERKMEEVEWQKFESEEKKESERRANAIALVERIHSLQFYKEVSAPAWEVIVKWRHWTGPRGDEYRFSVVSGHINYQQIDFEDPDKRSQLGHNFVRFHHHFHPADYPDHETGGEASVGYVQSTLSEHQALSYWLEYWGNVHTMIEARLVDEDLVRRSLADWYGYWAELVIELRWIVERLYEEKLNSKRRPDDIGEQLPNWIRETRALEESFYRSDRASWYSEIVKQCHQRASKIMEQISPLMEQRIAATSGRYWQ